MTVKIVCSELGLDRLPVCHRTYGLFRGKPTLPRNSFKHNLAITCSHSCLSIQRQILFMLAVKQCGICFKTREFRVPSQAHLSKYIKPSVTPLVGLSMGRRRLTLMGHFALMKAHGHMSKLFSVSVHLAPARNKLIRRDWCHYSLYFLLLHSVILCQVDSLHEQTKRVNRML